MFLHGDKRNQPWREFPELDDLPPVAAQDAFEAATKRAWRRPMLWVATLLALVSPVPLLMAYHALPDALRRHWIVGPLLGLAVVIGYLVLFIVVYEFLSRPTLRRCIRAEVGTYCIDCGYDLRGTPNFPPPAVTRCPECGRIVPRNVHRITISR
jgi:hypothetical protein